MKNDDINFGRHILAIAFLLMLLAALITKIQNPAHAEEPDFPDCENSVVVDIEEQDVECATPTDMTAPDTPESDEGIHEPENEATVIQTPTPEEAQEPEPTAEPTPKPRKKSSKKPVIYTVPQELLDADPAFAAIMAEANKYIGYPYVYGGSKPSTSFDCSGFVSWVYTESGVSNTGRKGANGLYKLCTPIEPEDARPGDLIFFQKTMGPDVKGITHVGIYVGNNWMIHCGDPISYADLTQQKWIDRFYGFGRLTYEGEYANEQEH